MTNFTSLTVELWKEKSQNHAFHAFVATMCRSCVEKLAVTRKKSFLCGLSCPIYYSPTDWNHQRFHSLREVHFFLTSWKQQRLRNDIWCQKTMLINSDFPWAPWKCSFSPISQGNNEILSYSQTDWNMKLYRRDGRLFWIEGDVQLW